MTTLADQDDLSETRRLTEEEWRALLRAARRTEPRHWRVRTASAEVATDLIGEADWNSTNDDGPVHELGSYLDAGSGVTSMASSRTRRTR